MSVKKKSCWSNRISPADHDKNLEKIIHTLALKIKKKYDLSGIYIYLPLLDPTKAKPQSRGELTLWSEIPPGESSCDPPRKSILIDQEAYSNPQVINQSDKSYSIFFQTTDHQAVPSSAENFLIFQLPFFKTSTILFINRKTEFNLKEIRSIKKACHSIVYEIESIDIISQFDQTATSHHEKKVKDQTEFSIEVLSNLSFYGEAIPIFKNFTLNTYLNQEYVKKFSLKDFKQAHQITMNQIKNFQLMVEEEIDESSYMVFSGHLLMLEDQEYLGRIEKKIKSGMNPPKAIVEVTQHYIEQFSKSNLLSIREKTLDIKDIGYRLIQNLLTYHSKVESLKDKVVLTNQIYPSEFLQFFYQGVRGVVVVGLKDSSDYITFHTKVIARSLKMGFAYLCDQEKKLLGHRKLDQFLLVNHRKKKIIFNPSAKSIKQLKKISIPKENQEFREITTRDQVPINLYGNINLSVEIERINQFNLKGVGLYRSEMFFMVHNYFPSEEIQYDYYSSLVTRLSGREIAIRTLDLGDDKILPYCPEVTKENSVLGLRAIRFSLKYQEIFKTQIRALLRVSDHHPLKIIIPFIYSLDEIIEVKKIFKQCLKDLKKQKLVKDPQFQLGIMIELPSTLFILEALADQVDFFSIGTNDLSRYLLAVDGNDSRVRSMLTYSHPSLLRSLHMIMQVVKKKKIETILCGVMGWNHKYLEFLLGIGIRNFSITPVAVPEFVKNIKKISLSKAEKKSAKLLTFSSIKDIKKYLE